MHSVYRWHKPIQIIFIIQLHNGKQEKKSIEKEPLYNIYQDPYESKVFNYIIVWLNTEIDELKTRFLALSLASDASQK